MIGQLPPWHSVHRLIGDQLFPYKGANLALELDDLRDKINKCFSKQYDRYFAERICIAYDCAIEKYNWTDAMDFDTYEMIKNICDVIPNMIESQQNTIENILDDLVYEDEQNYDDKIYIHGVTMHCIHYKQLSNAVIECKYLLKFKSTILCIVRISHNFYNNTYNMHILQKSNDTSPITIQPVQRGCNTFAFVGQNNWCQKEQWIFSIKKDCSKTAQHSFRVNLDVFRLSNSTNNSFNEHNTMSFILCLPVKYNDIRLHMFIQTVLDLYNIHIPNEIISLIFYLYDTKHFIDYNEPFVCGNLQLESQHFVNLKKELQKNGMYSWNEDQFHIDNAYFISNNNMNPQLCNINGIALILQIKDDTINVETCPEFFDLLQKNNIDSTDLTYLWMANKATEFFEAEIIYQTIKNFIIDYSLEDKIRINFQILIDKNIYDNNEFLMLWINWKCKINILHTKVDLLHRKYHNLFLVNNEDVEDLDHVNVNWKYSPLAFESLWPDIGGLETIKLQAETTEYRVKKMVRHSKRKMRYKTRKCQHKKMKYRKNAMRFMYNRW